MGRYKVKDSVPLTIRMDKSISDRLTEYSENSMIPKTRIVERAVQMYLDNIYACQGEEKLL